MDDNVFGNEMKRELPCLQHIRKLLWINHDTSSVLRRKLEKLKCEKPSNPLRSVVTVKIIMMQIFTLWFKGNICPLNVSN
jgi:hypothetical protein